MSKQAEEFEYEENKNDLDRYDFAEAYHQEQLKNIMPSYSEMLVTTLICTIDDLLPEDHFVRLSNSYRKLKNI